MIADALSKICELAERANSQEWCVVEIMGHNKFAGYVSEQPGRRGGVCACRRAGR